MSMGGAVRKLDLAAWLRESPFVVEEGEMGRWRRLLGSMLLFPGDANWPSGAFKEPFQSSQLSKSRPAAEFRSRLGSVDMMWGERMDKDVTRVQAEKKSLFVEW